MATTFVNQPQSSCPFRDASQKIFGLGYDLLVFVYEKTDTHETQSAAIDIRHAIGRRSDRLSGEVAVGYQAEDLEHHGR